MDRVLMGTSGCAYFGTSTTGALAYVPLDAGDGPPRTLAWVGRDGAEVHVPAPARAYQDLRLSPDGARVAVSIGVDDRDVWVWDFARESLTRVTSDPAADRAPVWFPDGRHILFASVRVRANNLYRQAADGSGAAERLTESGFNQLPFSITSDGAYVLGNQTRLGAWNLFRAPLAPPGPAEPLLELPGNENYPVVSPDGRLLAYSSDESGSSQVYLRPYPVASAARWQVSRDGGSHPKWSRDGREVFFRGSTRWRRDESCVCRNCGPQDQIQRADGNTTCTRCR